MQITEVLAGLGGLQSVARELGVSEGQVTQGADALLPAILGGFKKQAQARPGGLDAPGGLGELLGQLGGGGLLDQVLSPQPTDVSQGDAVLGQIFGSKDVSRTVAQNASRQTGLDTGLLKKMLPMLGMLVAGYLARQQGGGAAGAALPGGGGAADGLGGLLGGLLGGRAGAAGTGGLGGLLDMNGDGNALDDILNLAGRAMR
jgi:hypothetical protein